jgi:hypothetical protein
MSEEFLVWLGNLVSNFLYKVAHRPVESVSFFCIATARRRALTPISLNPVRHAQHNLTALGSVF